MTITHVVFSLALSAVLILNTPFTVLGAIIPDMDYLVRIEHRTFMHSFLFIIIILLIFYRRSPRKTISFTIGFLSHLMLDVITPNGIMVFYPLQEFFTLGITNSYNSVHNLLIILLSLLILWNKHDFQEMLRGVGSKKVRICTFLFLTSPIILSIPVTLMSPYLCEKTTISTLIKLPKDYEEKCVTIKGNVCSEIREYTANSGNTYQIFDLCNNSKIKIWKMNTVEEKEFEKNDCLIITGIFTSKYLNKSGYELYKIKKVKNC